MLDISVWDISGKKKSRFGLVAEPSVAIIVILSMEIAGIVILMSVTIGTVAAPIDKLLLEHVGLPPMSLISLSTWSIFWLDESRGPF